MPNQKIEKKEVSGIITGFYHYGNGIVFRIGQKTKLWIPQNFLSREPAEYLALKIKTQAFPDKYYGGKFKTLYTVSNSSDFTIEKNTIIETNIDKKIELLFKALGKTSVYKKIFQTKTKKETLKIKSLAKTCSPAFIFKLVSKGHIDFLGGLAFFYLLHGTDENMPLLSGEGYKEAFSWLFWMLYKDEKTAKISFKKAYESIQKILNLKLPPPELLLQYFLNKNAFYFYLKNEENINNIEKIKNYLNDKNNEINLLQFLEDLYFYDWKYKTMKEHFEAFISEKLNANPELTADIVFDKNQEIDIDKLYYYISQHPITIISGPPGAGKSTIIKTLSSILESNNLKVCRTAPTGFASINIDGITIAQAFDIFEHNQKNFKSIPATKADIIFIDETSQVPLDVFFKIIKKIKPNQKLIFSGDPNQLSPVEGENVFEIIVKKAKEKNKLIELKKVYRFLPEKKTFIYLFDDQQSILYATAFIYLYYTLKQKNELLIMTPYHRNFTGTKKLNLLIKTLLDNIEQNKLTYHNLINNIKKVISTKNINNEIFMKKGTKVIITKNIYYAGKLLCVNKDIGTIEEVIEKEKAVYVKINRNQLLVKIPQKDVFPAYAIEFFASQGQECDCSIIIIPPGYVKKVESDESFKKALYTTATRAKKYTFFLLTQDSSPTMLEYLLKNELKVNINKVEYISKDKILKKLHNLNQEIQKNKVPKKTLSITK